MYKSLKTKTIREYRRGNQKRTIQRDWQDRIHKTKKNKTKKQHNMCWTPLCANKDISLLSIQYLYLHVTRKDVCWLAPVPTSLSAKHLYIPSSEVSTFVIVRDGEKGETGEYLDTDVSTSIHSPFTNFLQ